MAFLIGYSIKQLSLFILLKGGQILLFSGNESLLISRSRHKFMCLSLEWNPTHLNKFQFRKYESWIFLLRCCREIEKIEVFGLFRDVLGRQGGSCRKEWPRKTDIQGSPTPGSRAVHHNKQKVRQKCQEVCMDGQGASDKTQA